MPITLTNDVRAVLERSTITADSLTLPPQQLDRKLYEAVNKVLVAAGGKWNRSAKAHVFASDPRECLGLALKSGKVTSKKQKLQAFYTPADLAARVVTLADVSGCTVLEPSAGAGALAKECKARGASHIDAVEINRDCEKQLDEVCDDVFLMDFLEMEPPPVLEHDRVVMNPPFTKNQDIAHVRHALKFLKPGGRLVAIMAGNTERKAFRDMMDAFAQSSAHPIIFELPAGAFKESGTNVQTIILTVTKG
ncbi:RsmD family RNA methyltransferase [Ruficoccus amylovorans]|uniref:RsmD family RNA methyltransferase n=1 Tax=Ruficoccus amylovorans TaxID=1804625 RepID=A0A842HEA3_9BACT|nr:RsmD family RNA methyltransferase [Ruficoccus amylovorans]MBC2594905.1 RsmD family RNA methyltransferase [Ruficoccus amylovorans]